MGAAHYNGCMPAPILATKLYIPPPRAVVVPRWRLIDRLDEGLARGCKLTLVSASAGFGKTTLVSEWVAQCARPVAWLALDEGDNDLTRFLTYLAAALQTVAAEIGNAALAMLQAPQPPPSEAILIPLLNEIAALPEPFVLVLDDYHVIDSQVVDQALTFLIDHQPPQMHLVIATRQDPALPLARLRARGQLSELRAADLRFTPSEAAEFLNQVMRLDLSAEDIAALEARTEGWIAGLQLAAISMQGRLDTASFIQAFTGSHHFVLDFLIEEVLGQQSESVQEFLLRTSILERMCAPLCEAILPGVQGGNPGAARARQPVHFALDDERRWYRYHHLFADLLRQRLGQDCPPGRSTRCICAPVNGTSRTACARSLPACPGCRGVRAGGAPGRRRLAGHGAHFSERRLAWLGEENPQRRGLCPTRTLRPAWVGVFG